MRKYLVLDAIILYVFLYQICELFYSNDVDSWYKLKYTLLSTIVASLVLVNKVEDENLSEGKKTEFLLNVFVGVLISDIIDRVYFTTDFTYTDFVLLFINIMVNVWLSKELRKKINCKLINLYQAFTNNSS